MADSAANPRAPGDFVVEKVSAVPPMTVRAMVQTRDGYLWIGGYDGLYRFDGVRLVAFNVANTPSMASDAVRVLYEDASNNLWIGTDDAGVMLLRDGEFHHIGSEPALAATEVQAICQDRDQTVWVGTRAGLFSLVTGSDGAWAARHVLSKATVHALAAAPDGELWVGASKGLFRLGRGRTEPEVVLTNRVVQSLAIDSSNVVWATADSRANYRIASRGAAMDIEPRPMRFWSCQPGTGGAFWLAGLKGILYYAGPGDLSNATVVTQFERREIGSICEDTDGNIWVGVESHGLHRVRRKRVSMLTSEHGIPTENLATILEDSAGRIWLGTFGKGLLVARDGQLPFEARPIPSVVNVTGLRETRDGTLWLGTYNANRYRWNQTQFVAVTKGAAGCRVIYEDRDGALWIGTLRNGVERHEEGRIQRFSTSNGLSSDIVLCLVQDGRGDMWVGTHRGLNRISQGRLKRFPGEDTLRRRTILGLYVDSRGDLWIGTIGAGLLRFSQENLQAVTPLQGLPSDFIEDVLEDDEDRIWLATGDGIACVPREELTACAEGRKSFMNCITLGTEDGMVLARCGTGFKPGCMKSRSGLLWFGTAGGMVVVDPRTIRPRAHPPPVYIEEVLADDKPVPLQRGPEPHGHTAVIQPGTSRVGFRYTALGLTAPERIRFRYQLDGYDPDWVSARGARTAYYTHLPAGDYQFRVRATGKSGVANETGATLAVMVIPSWWQTWWFRAVAVVCLTGLVFGAYELRVQQHKKARTAQELFARRLIESQEQERKRVAAELHDSLGQSLQVIKGRAQLGLNRALDSPGSATQFEEISTAASQAIQEVRAISHALRPAELDQLGLARAVEWMVEKNGATSTTRFGCEVDGVDRLPPEMEISLYRIAQEGINNVLKHANATEAILQLQREAGAVRFSIFDNGRGFVKPACPDGQGLMGIAERVRLLGGKFEIQSAPGKGTRLTATIPLPPDLNLNLDLDRNPNPNPDPHEG